MYRLVLIRHGQSEWNKMDLFTGWEDVSLSQQGVEEALHAGRVLKENGFEFDLAYTSVLKRAIKTMNLALEEAGQLWLPVKRSWRLNERHYGALQGLNKQETREKYGDEQVHVWRRSYDVRPPLLEKDDSRWQGGDRRYEGVEVPFGECLKDTYERFIPYWEEELKPQILSGKRLVIAAHGNSIRAMVKHLEGMSGEEIVKEEIPTGNPLVYELDENLKVLKKYYLK